MTLTTHALVGASLAALVPRHPVAGFAAGFLSNFILDAVPHWDYKLRSRRDNKDRPLDGDIQINAAFARDLIRVAFDGLLGILVALLIFRPDTNLALGTLILGGLGLPARQSVPIPQTPFPSEVGVRVGSFFPAVHC